MDKALVAGMLVTAAISVVMIGIVSLVPSIGSSSQAISEAYNEVTDRRLVALEVLAVNQQSELMEAWVKNVGTTTIDAIDKMDIFLERVDGPGIERISYYPGTGDPHKTWSGDLWEQGIPWDPKSTMHITVGLSAEQLFVTCVSNQQKWDTLGAERSWAGWRSGELPDGPIVASPPFDGLSLHLLPAL